MNTTTARLIAALSLSLAASGAAFAQEASYDYPQAASSQTTRAAVLADLAQAQAQGTMIISEAYVGRMPEVGSTLSRADVRSEAVAALANGQTAALTAEPSGFAPVLRPSVTTTMVAAR